MRPFSTEPVETVIATSMQEADIERLMRWPHTNLCTDGSLAGSHPRGFGSYPRFLGRYVRERRIMDLATAVHKASQLAATHVGIRDRGAIGPGMMADLVLFDPTTVLDRATPQAPHALSVGIHTVWVNGEIVYENGRTTGRLPGRGIRREGASPTGLEAGRSPWYQGGARAQDSAASGARSEPQASGGQRRKRSAQRAAGERRSQRAGRMR